jgi:hypothetical protein
MALKLFRLKLAGVVYNNYKGGQKDYIYLDNLTTISRAVAPVPVIEVEYNHTPDSRLAEFCDALRKRFL